MSRAAVEIDKPKSPIFTVPIAVDEAVRGLDVPVQHAARVRGVETGDHLQDRVDRLGRRQRTVFAARGLSSVPPAQQLHRDDRRAGDFVAAEDVDAVGMA